MAPDASSSTGWPRSSRIRSTRTLEQAGRAGGFLSDLPRLALRLTDVAAMIRDADPDPRIPHGRQGAGGAGRSGASRSPATRPTDVSARLQRRRPGYDRRPRAGGRLQAHRDVREALAAYEQARREATTQIVRTNREFPPDFINIKVEELVGDRPFDNLDRYITQERAARCVGELQTPRDSRWPMWRREGLRPCRSPDEAKRNPGTIPQPIAIG